jgi:predicted NUDIX family NTP pyrophosphohydrolase
LVITVQKEFQEEIGIRPTGPFIDWLQSNKGRHIVHAWHFMVLAIQ